MNSHSKETNDFFKQEIPEFEWFFTSGWIRRPDSDRSFFNYVVENPSKAQIDEINDFLTANFGLPIPADEAVWTYTKQATCNTRIQFERDETDFRSVLSTELNYFVCYRFEADGIAPLFRLKFANWFKP